MIDLQSEFPLKPGILYLNHAGVGPWPMRTTRAVETFARENSERGAQRYPQWLETEAALRRQLAEWIHAPGGADDIALLKNTSEGLSLVAYGVDWRAGDEVIYPAQEFPSNRVVWESLQRLGVHSRAVDVSDAKDPEAELCGRATDRTRLIAVSSVQYGTGLRLDLRRIGTFCRDQGILFCVDAIQSLGVLPLDVEAVHADFVAADAHKWLLGPEGIALFYCRAELREQLLLHEYGWHMLEHAYEFDRTDWLPAASARRFECGSPNMVGIHALHASLSLFLELGMDTVAADVQCRVGAVIDALESAPGWELLTPAHPQRHAGIVTFRPRRRAAAEVYERLMADGVICALRAGGIRFSPHFYTPLDRLADAIDRVLHL